MTCATVINYLENESKQDSQIAIYEHTFECPNTPFTDSLTIEELLDTDKESYELRYNLESQRLHIWLPITITFPKYENEDYKKYIENVIKEINSKQMLQSEILIQKIILKMFIFLVEISEHEKVYYN